MRDVQESGKEPDGVATGADPETAQYIERREGVVGGEPVIVDTRISVRDVVLYWREYGDVDEIADALDIPIAAINAALAYYDRHKNEIDRYIREDEEAGEAIEREYHEARGR
jgi:uncharacterized protein (DUF433 family)